MQDIIREVPEWNTYQLLDSGDGEKCERFGDVVVSRPDPLAIWHKNDPQEHWENADLVFTRDDQDAGWEHRNEISRDWNVSYNDLVFLLKPSAFKHVGLFPEQAANWEWMCKHLKKK